MAKVLIGRVYPRLEEGEGDGFSVDHQSFASFDRKLHIFRDPRDTLVSSFLYSVRHTSFYADSRRLSRFLGLLEEKERSPRSVSMVQLLDLMAELDGGVELLPSFVRRQGLVATFLDRYPDYHRVRYVDLIDDNLGPVASYLGFPLHAPARIETRVRVERTLGYGDWKNWFTEDDVVSLRPVLDEYVALAGLGHDWTLADAPAIPAAFASDYVRRIVQEKRDKDRGRWLRRVRRLPWRVRAWGVR